MATYREKRGTNVVPIVSGQPTGGVNGEIVYITGEGLASYNNGTWSKLTASAIYKHFIGTDKAFSCGGEAYTNTLLTYNTINAISFASDGNATDWGDLIVAGRGRGMTASSPSDGMFYLMARDISNYYYKIEKITTSSASNSVQIGGTYIINSMVIANVEGASGESETHGIIHSIGSNQPSFTTVQAIAFASGTSAMNNMTGTNNEQYGHSYTCCMSTHIFYCGGQDKVGSTVNAKQIRKYANAGDTNQAAHGSAELSKRHSEGASGTSDTHGFVAGGYSDDDSAKIKRIDSFPYASETNSSDHGDLLFIKQYTGGQASSASHGYDAGGTPGASPFGRNTIEKYSTTSAANSTDVGDLVNPVQKNCLGYK